METLQLPVIITLVALTLALTVRVSAKRELNRRRTWARLSADGVQEATILVRRGYQPETVRVRAGLPVRLSFRRDEDDPASAHIYLSEPSLSRHLPPFATTVVRFTPGRVGEHLFTSEEGRFRGHLIVAPAAGVKRERRRYRGRSGWRAWLGPLASPDRAFSAPRFGASPGQGSDRAERERRGGRVPGSLAAVATKTRGKAAP